MMNFTFLLFYTTESVQRTQLTMKERLLSCIQGCMIEILANTLPKATAGLQFFFQFLKAYARTAAHAQS
jgi:hypothetical protein